MLKSVRFKGLSENKSFWARSFIFVVSLCFIVSFFIHALNVQFIKQDAGLLKNFSLFWDAFYHFARSSERNPYFGPGSEAALFLPLSYLIVYPFGKFMASSALPLSEITSTNAAVILVLFFMAFMLVSLFWALDKICKKYGVSPYIIFPLAVSCITLHAIKTGNPVILSAAGVAVFIAYYDSESPAKRVIAACAIALSAALKIYPVLFGFLYFEKKQYKDMLQASVITLCAVFLPFLFLKGGFSNIPRLWEIQKSVAAAGDQVKFSTIWAASTLGDFFPVMYIFTAIPKYVYALISIALSLFQQDKWKRLALLTFAVLYIPEVTNFYTGLYLFPLIIMFFASVNTRNIVFNIFIFLCLTITLLPVNENLAMIVRGNTLLFVLWLAVLAAGINDILKEHIKLKTKIVKASGVILTVLAAAALLFFIAPVRVFLINTAVSVMHRPINPLWQERLTAFSINYLVLYAALALLLAAGKLYRKRRK